MKQFIKAILITICALILFFPTRGQTTGTSFFYVVTAVDSNNFESAFSNQATAVLNTAHHTTNLTWTASTSTGIASYNIYRGTVSGGPYAKIGNVTGTTLAFVDTYPIPNPPSGLSETTP